ncbi:hypothetical protein N9972_00295 [bacterium]|nr:hypothetical protein [bacterium]
MATLAAKANVKALNPRSPDTKYVGHEPEWRVQPVSNRTSSLSNAFGWYNYFYGKKDAKDFIASYLDAHERAKDARRIRTLPDSQIRLTTGWLCRMVTVGLELSESEQIKLDNLIQELLAEKQAEPTEVVEAKPAGPTIQDRLKEKASECAGEIEGLFDDFVAAGAKMSAQFQPITIIRGHNVAPQLIHQIQQIWKGHLTELEAVVAGKDAQLVEGYGRFTKTQLKQLVKFAEQVITDCNNYVQIKKVERKPRAKKAVSAEKVTARFKYLKTFPDLKLVSEPAVKLVDATEAWLYDTVKRKLIHVVGDAHRGNFTVKSSAVVGFDTGASSQKTLRKPAETLKALLAAGKPATRKIFKELSTTETQWNGRGNENLIILKAW